MEDVIIKKLFDAIDAKDSEKFVEFLSQDACFRFGNSETVIGREDIKNSVSKFFSSLKSLNHNIVNIWEFENTIICEGKVTYIKQDSCSYTFPFVNILRIDNNLICNYRIYIDISPFI